ncbi:MAG: flagellar basal body rod protein FlgB [bacterium]|nr:flagellar basal body rod protein FlgB [bacterium]
MIKTGFFKNDHLDMLKKALDVYAKRHEVTVQNVANVETGGYRAQKVKFEEMLSSEQMRLRGYATHPDHMRIGASNAAEMQEEVVDAGTDFDNGINNVDIDGEMTNLATNDLSYRLATRLLSGRYNTLRGAIRGRMT